MLITFGKDGCLTGQLLEHLGGSCQSVTGLAHANVDAELANAQLSHDILGLVLGIAGLLGNLGGGGYFGDLLDDWCGFSGGRGFVGLGC